MESTQNDLETSMDITIIHPDPKFSNTSDSNIPEGTDASGLVDIRKTISEKGIGYGSFKSIEESENFRKEIINRRNKIYFQKDLMEIKSFIPPTKEVSSTSLLLKFSKKVEDLINNKSTFRKLISQIEIGLNKFIEIKNMGIDSSIFLEEDWEIPDYEKLVLFLKFEGIPFDEELKLWKKISSIIYERIKFLITISTEEDIKIIKEWKKNFFIKVDM